MDFSKVNLIRQYRTPHSEGYVIRQESEDFARLDLHFGSESSYATLVLFQDSEEEEVLDLIAFIDDQLVISADTAREDFYVTVYRGEEVGFYTDDFLEEHRQRRRAGGNGQE